MSNQIQLFMVSICFRVVVLSKKVNRACKINRDPRGKICFQRFVKSSKTQWRRIGDALGTHWERRELKELRELRELSELEEVEKLLKLKD